MMSRESLCMSAGICPARGAKLEASHARPLRSSESAGRQPWPLTHAIVVSPPLAWGRPRPWIAPGVDVRLGAWRHAIRLNR